ncbi:hypothetical protein BDW22DRAFT_1358624 [Trametopsis cervina]|nr:hypothetical protein BDW22DRAFT_1358624 [Trametopsis cervina]
MLISFLITQTSRCWADGWAFVEHYVYIYCRFCLWTLGALLTSAEALFTRIFEWESRLLAVPACGAYTPQQSAIVIIGGEAAGLGRAVSLSLSERGFTVFALCSAGLETVDPSRQASSTKSSDVSSLLFAWHRRKEKLPHTSWGLVAPILLDMRSGVQRTHAFETVHAYCVKHSLNLAALIVLVPASAAKRKEHGSRHPNVSMDLAHPDEHPSTQEAPETQSLMDPVLVIEDYIDMLALAAGRVVFLTHGPLECYLCRPVALLDGVIQRIAQNMSQQLESVGIRVCSISVGPVGRLDEQGNAARFELPADGDSSCSRLHMTISNVLGLCTVEFGAFSEDLHNILTTRYPRYSYSMGIYPFLDSIRLGMPDIVRQVLTHTFR